MTYTIDQQITEQLHKIRERIVAELFQIYVRCDKVDGQTQFTAKHRKLTDEEMRNPKLIEILNTAVLNAQKRAQSEYDQAPTVESIKRVKLIEID